MLSSAAGRVRKSFSAPKDAPDATYFSPNYSRQAPAYAAPPVYGTPAQMPGGAARDGGAPVPVFSAGPSAVPVARPLQNFDPAGQSATAQSGVAAAYASGPPRWTDQGSAATPDQFGGRDPTTLPSGVPPQYIVGGGGGSAVVGAPATRPLDPRFPGGRRSSFDQYPGGPLGGGVGMTTAGAYAGQPLYPNQVDQFLGGPGFDEQDASGPITPQFLRERADELDDAVEAADVAAQRAEE